MNCCRETTKMGVPTRHREPARSGEAGGPPGNRRVLVSVPQRYVAGADTLGRQEGWPYSWSQQLIHEISGFMLPGLEKL
jgi:hypothetical protein